MHISYFNTYILAACDVLSEMKENCTKFLLVTSSSFERIWWLCDQCKNCYLGLQDNFNAKNLEGFIVKDVYSVSCY